jgi:hemoglobin-like flavoprotein
MTSDQIHLIRQTFALVAPHADAAASAFYKRLFELDPSLRPLFRPDLTEQGHKLMACCEDGSPLQFDFGGRMWD